MKEKLKTLAHYPAVFLFFAFIVVFSICDSFANDRKMSELENRQLSQKPALTMQNLFAANETEKFSYLYEQYINDQFLGRDNWISLKSRTESLLLKTENNGVLYGQGGTMYQKFFTLPQAVTGGTQLEANIANVSKFMARHPGLVKVMVVPSADRILADKAPAGAPFVDETPWMNRMTKAFGQNGTFIDLTSLLQAHSGEYLYYRTDHHWTTLGAYYAYTAYAAATGRQAVPVDTATATAVPGFLGTLYSKAKLYNAVPDELDYYPALDRTMTVMELASEQKKTEAAQVYKDGLMSEDAYKALADQQKNLYDTEKLDTRDKYALFLYGNNGFSRIAGTGTGRVLVIKDSYANCFVPFLAQSYAQVDVIDLRSLKSTGLDALIAENNYDDVLVLYNFQSFSSDTNLVLLNLYNN